MAAFFEDAADYDRLMARWSRAAAAAFLGWLDPAPGARWLDVGCGTGVVTAAIVERSRAASVTGVDVAPTLLARASERLRGSAALALADARSLPFPGRSFDVVVAALVLNFIAEPAQAIADMKRVGRRGGLLGAVVWDYAGGRSPLAPLRAALGEIGGVCLTCCGRES